MGLNIEEIIELIKKSNWKKEKVLNKLGVVIDLFDVYKIFFV